MLVLPRFRCACPRLVPNRLSTFDVPNHAQRCRLLSPRQPCGRKLNRLPALLARRLKAWPSPQLSTCPSARIYMRRHRLLPSPSRFRRDRRDPDHGRARGGGAIRQCVAGRASLSDGALEEAARPCAGRDRRKSPGLVLYTLLEEDLIQRWKRNAASSACPACRCWGRSCGCSSPISAPRPSTAPAPSTCSMPNISSASTRSTSP